MSTVSEVRVKNDNLAAALFSIVSNEQQLAVVPTGDIQPDGGHHIYHLNLIKNLDAGDTFYGFVTIPISGATNDGKKISLTYEPNVKTRAIYKVTGTADKPLLIYEGTEPFN